MKRRIKVSLVVTALAVPLVGISCLILSNAGQGTLVSYPISKENLSEALRAPLNAGELPEKIVVQKGWVRYEGQARYTVDPVLQNKMVKLFKTYRPDYGAFIAIDAKSGAILSLVSHSENREFGNVNLQASFPAASVFKIVTAAAAFERAQMTPESVVSFNGANHTLYKRNVTGSNTNRWTRNMTLREAFAKSVNTVFGKVGAFAIKPDDLEEYAHRYLFNLKIPADIPVEPGKFSLEKKDSFSIAEVASGYNRIALMSPLQGALIAASVINGGVIMEPYVVQSVTNAVKGPIYYAEPRVLASVVSPECANSLKELMYETVKSGTSRKSFRPYLRKNRHEEIEIGGKTGSLTGLSPKGKYDWFVGYVGDGEQKIALAALTINEETWKVKSSVVARTFMESYFRHIPADSYAIPQDGNTRNDLSSVD